MDMVMKLELPAAATPATACFPSRATKYRSIRR